MKSKISKFDWFVYKLFRWRWNPILESHPAMCNALSMYLKVNDNDEEIQSK